VACEKYRSLSSPTERTISARDIFERHLCLGALEPVNVDSHARQATQDGLTDASSTLFLQAQKQIFNLMKFDSYPRFLKSDLYKECLVRELSGQDLPFPGGDNLDTGLQLHGTSSSPSHSKVQWHFQVSYERGGQRYMNVNDILKRSIFFIAVKQADKCWSLCVQSLNSLCSFYRDVIKTFVLYLLNICMLRILFCQKSFPPPLLFCISFFCLHKSWHVWWIVNFW
jgi:hypothetical protein